MGSHHRNDVQHIIKSRCGRQDHVIHVTYGGAVIFVSHGGMRLQTLINEGHIRSPHSELKGCYYFANRVLDSHRHHDYFQPPYKSRRTSSLASLHKAGLDDVAAGHFLYEKGGRRSKRQDYRTDEYPRPFHEIARARINRIYLRIRTEQEDKLSRVIAKLKEKGFKLEEHYYRINDGS
jgi:hypothetical protein